MPGSVDDTPLYVGVMSGTSLDGIDVVLAELAQAGPRVRCARTYPFPDALRATLARLCGAASVDLETLCVADAELGELIAECVLALLDEAGVAAQRVTAIGSHGQTIRHAPRHPRHPFTCQIGDAHRIAERTSIAVIDDFRRRDVAAGGEGAPLVPAFHGAVFGCAHDRVVVNIGGMANVTLLPAGGPGASRTRHVTGFDTGPGNVLLDTWARRHLDAPLDDGGRWAAQGRIEPALLERLLADDYFAAPAPKSTGREHFDAHWLETRIEGAWAPAAVQATLVELTARTIADGIRGPGRMQPRDVLVCGGGRHNTLLMERLAHALPDSAVRTTDEEGIDGDWVEALAFAWLAQQHLAGRAGNVPAVTGAAGTRILGRAHAAGGGPARADTRPDA